jgi:predicted nuclease of predicted toxin-antitoxin system
MKFLADMGISPKTVTHLQALGHDVVHLHDQGLDLSSDAEILEKARREDRVLLTHDLDFGELVAASGARLPSVVIFRLRNMRPECVNRYLEEIATQHKDALAEGAIVSAREGQVRVRALPLSAGQP